MALPPGITPKTVTIGIASFFDGALAEGTATITAPVNVVHTPTNRPIFSSQMSKRFVDGEVSFDLAPTDAPGLNRVDWTYKLNVVIAGALVQPEPIWFTLPAAGPDEIDLDALVTVPSSAGTPISVDVLTADDLSNPDSTASVALRAAYVPFWKPNEVVAQDAVRMTAAGVTIKRNSAGTTRASYDATEAALWTVTGGSGGGSVSDASTTVKGIVELATTAETTTGTDSARAVTPAGVKAVVDTLPASYMTVVNHGGTAGTARPAGAAAVLWVGTVTPTNMTAADLYNGPA